MSATPDPEVREALEELAQYLSDTVPPLVVADDFAVLIRHSPQIVASAIHSWTGGQYGRGNAGVPVSDFLFHALKKVHLLGEFRLLPAVPFQDWFEQLVPLIVALCPEADRPRLEESLTHLSDSSPVSSAPQRLFRQSHESSDAAPGAAAARASAGAPPADSPDWRRLSLLMERLDNESRGPGGRTAVSPETLAAAARGSRNAGEIESFLGRLKELGLGVGTDEVFRALARSLPSWSPPAAGEWAPGAVPTSGAAEAMRRMVAEAGDPREGARRFAELVRAATDRFNEGSLAQAVSTLELAEKLIAEKKVDPGTVDIARRKGDEPLDPEKLKKFADSPAQHPQLRRLLSFFFALSPKGLLEELRREEKRDRRRLLLLLLEVHGASAREAVLEELQIPFHEIGADAWYYRRNLLYVLRRIPRPPEVSPDDPSVAEEVDLVVRHAEPGFPPGLVREAIANLGQLRHERSERALVGHLADIEGMLARPEESPLDPKDLRQLLDRIVAALARFGTSSARRAVVEHGLRRDPKLGDTLARLTELSTQDLSNDPDVVERLLAFLRAGLPRKVLGIRLPQNAQGLPQAIAALSGTSLPAVREALDDVAARFKDQELGRSAARALAGLPGPDAAAAGAPEPAAASLSGDLDLFGLPALLQSLGESAVTGCLTLRHPTGDAIGTLTLSAGKLQACQVGALTGEEAFYQLLERPQPGVFQFAREPSSGAPEGGRDLLPLVLEAMRRCDELQEAAALVPDDAIWKSTQVRPTPHPQEKDGLLLKSLWTRISRGTSARQCEAEVATDSFRIRRVLAHWVEEGALGPGDIGEA